MTEKTRDFITFEPKKLMIIEDNEVLEVIHDDKYERILIVLRNNPMTVEEIVEAYNKDLKKPKSKSRIYQYLQKLEKINLITLAGQRVTMGKTTTEKIFARTADMFYPAVSESEFWTKILDDNKVDIISSLISQYTNQKKIPAKKMRQFIYDVYSYGDKEIEQMFREVDENLSSKLSQLRFEDFDQIIHIIERLILVIKPTTIKYEDVL